MHDPAPRPLRGRGTTSRPAGRFARTETVTDAVADASAWRAAATELRAEPARRIISRNESPDLAFRQSINPYRGCEHGCIYCYARPSHAYADLSPGLDFERRIAFKPDAARLLRRELSRPAYVVSPIVLGANTDAYQPAERELGITRAILEVLREFRHPVNIVTKSALIERDLDLLSELAADGLVSVMVSITTRDDELKRRMEPRAAAPARRLETLRRLATAGVPRGVLFAPVIPGLNDHELEDVLTQAAAAGAQTAAYVLLRLPHEVRELFQEWLVAHYPLKARRVLGRIREMRGGGLNDPCFGSRLRGQGPFAALLARRFEQVCRRTGLARGFAAPLRTDAFRRAPCEPAQLDLLGGTPGAAAAPLRPGASRTPGT